MPNSPQPLKDFDCDYLIVGEGAGDAALFRYLCEIHGLDHFQIEDAAGSSKLLAYLKGLKLRPQFERLKAILIVRDCDDGPDASFNEVKGFLKKAGLPDPQGPLKVKRTIQMNPDSLAIVVMMIPFTNAGGPTRGCLDTLLLQALVQTNPKVRQCVDAFFTCIESPRSRNLEDKFRLRCSLAALYPDDPNYSLQWALSPELNLIDLNHACFGEIVAFLQNFIQFCEPS